MADAVAGKQVMHIIGSDAAHGQEIVQPVDSLINLLVTLAPEILELKYPVIPAKNANELINVVLGFRRFAAGQ